MLFFSRKSDAPPVAFTQIMEARRALHLVLPEIPGDGLRALGEVRQWPALFSSMQIIGDGWDLPLLQCMEMEGKPKWTPLNREIRWDDNSLVIDLNTRRPKHLPAYPRKAAVVRMGEGSNLDLTPAPKRPEQLITELARLTGLPVDKKQPTLTIPDNAVSAARRLLRPEAKQHVFIHATKAAGKKTVLGAASTVKQMLSCAVYLSGVPAWKHDIPDVHYVQPSNLLELYALANACDAAVLGDDRLGTLTSVAAHGAISLSRLSPAELADSAKRARLQADLRRAINAK